MGQQQKPTEAQVKALAIQLVGALGGAVHLRVSDLALNVDAIYPGMTQAEFLAMRNICASVVADMMQEAMRRMWGSQ